MPILSPKVVNLLVATTATLLLLGCSPSENQRQQQVDQTVIRNEAPALGVDYAAMRKQQIKNVDYKLSVKLGAEKDFFEGQVDIHFELSSSNISPVTVDFNGGDILSITLNGKPVEWEYNDWFISLKPDPFIKGENTLAVTYSRKFATNGSGLHRFKDPETAEVYLYTDFEPYDANRLFPHFDQPNLKASYILDVHAPLNWQVISAVREESIIENESANTRHWIFPKSPEMSSYVFSLHAGPYYTWEDQAGDIPLRLFARQEIAKYVKTDDWFTPTKKSFAFFNDYFSLKYPFVKYDQIIVPDFNSGAMENIASVTFNEKYVKRGEKTVSQRLGLANTIAHEMAHMWFGDLVTMNWWNGLWLNESFATYMAYLELEKASGFENTWEVFYSRTKQWAYQTDQLVTTHSIELPVASTSDAFTNFDGITYGKGASVLKQLSHFLGEEYFRKGVSQYLKKYSYSNTTLDDFINELSLAANMDLDEWKQQWLYQTGLNTIKLDYSCENGIINKMALLQTAPEQWPTLRQQRIQVGLYQSQGDKMQLMKLIPMTYDGASSSVTEAVGQKCPELVYPNVDDWGYAKVQLDEPSLTTLKQKINMFDKPGMRMMLWQNLWDSVRDANMSIDDYVEFVIANIAQETEAHVVQQVSYTLSGAYRYLTKLHVQDGVESSANKKFSKVRKNIEQFVWAQLLDAKAGSDIQKQWLTTAMSVTHTPKGMNNARSLLNSDLVLEGMTIDQGRRWKLIVVLNHYQYSDYKQLLAAEIKADDSDMGVKMAIAAEVIRPELAIKKKWFKIVVDSLAATSEQSEAKKYKLSTMRYAMDHLFPADQVRMKETFDDKILSVFPILDKQANPQTIRSYVRRMMPAVCNSDSVNRLAKAVETYSNLSPIVVKGIRIGRQEDQRCVDIGKRLNT